MPRPNNGPRLTRGRYGKYDIAWTEAGRSFRRATGSTDFGEAQKILANFILLKGRDDLDRVASGDVPMLVSEALDRYLLEHVETKVIDKERVKNAAKHLRPLFGPLQVREIRATDVSGYVTSRQRKDIQHSTIRRELGTLIAAINYALRQKWIKADDVPVIELPPKPGAKDRWLTHEEADKLLAVCKARPPVKGRYINTERLPRIYRFVVLALATWSRKEAIQTLTRGQVDLERRMIYLNPTGRAQTKKRRPPVPIADWAFNDIERMVKDAERDGLDYLLDIPGSIRHAFETAIKDAGLTDVTPHTLRHTGATWAAQQGVDLFQIAGVLGDSLKTVEENYLHHCPEHLRGAVNAARKAA